MPAPLELAQAVLDKAAQQASGLPKWLQITLAVVGILGAVAASVYPLLGVEAAPAVFETKLDAQSAHDSLRKEFNERLDKLPAAVWDEKARRDAKRRK
jgi:hypothetical protein